MHCIVIKNFSVMYTHIIHNVDHHSSMLNITSRLAVRLRYLPDWDFDWSDNNAQQKRQSLELEDFLPDEEDGHHIHTRAVEYTMRFLVNDFTSLEGLRKHAPDHQKLHPVVKTEVVPQQVLFKDEKYIQETIEIISQLIDDADLKGDPQVWFRNLIIHVHNTCAIL